MGQHFVENNMIPVDEIAMRPNLSFLSREDKEKIDQVRQLHRGIPVDDDMLAVDVIEEVGADGNFLTHPHTLKYLRSTQWRPKLISRMGFDQWQSTGSTSLLGRAKKKLQQILEEHQPFPIPEDQAQEIQKRVGQFRQ